MTPPAAAISSTGITLAAIHTNHSVIRSGTSTSPGPRQRRHGSTMAFGRSDSQHGSVTEPGALASKTSTAWASVATLVRSGSGSVGVAATIGADCSIISPPIIETAPVPRFSSW